MALTIYFNDFIDAITPKPAEQEQAKLAHQRLSSLVDQDPSVQETRLQGSYRRGTLVRPLEGQRLDVDLVVITRLNQDQTPRQALSHFRPMLRQNYNRDWDTQGRSIGITDRQHGVDLDLVIAISDHVPWHNQPLRIPDREAERWLDAHPFAQEEFTRQRNEQTHGNYAQVVKALKNLRIPGRVRGYRLEALVGRICPPGITSVEEGIVETLRAIAQRGPGKPFVPNPGLPRQDVLGRLSEDDYARFYEVICDLARRADQAYRDEDPGLWREVLGDRFPAAHR